MKIKIVTACFAVFIALFCCACDKDANTAVVQNSSPTQSETSIPEESVDEEQDVEQDVEQDTEQEEEQKSLTYTLTATGTGCEVTFVDGKEEILHGETVRFSVVFDKETYDETMLSVTLNGQSVTGDIIENGAYVYEYGNVSENIEVFASIQKYVYTVTFSAPQGWGFWDVVREYEHGETIPDQDIPMYFETGWQCVWNIPNRTVTESVIYYPFVCKTLETVSEFLAIERTNNYILIKDIDFAGIELTAQENGAVIPYFEGALYGNGYALKNLTFSGAETKFLFGELCHATFCNVRMETVTFAGTSTTVYGDKAYGCALIGKMVSGTTLNDCHFDVIYTATGSAEHPNAGLVYELVGGSFSACTLILRTPTGDAKQDEVYQVCVILATGASEAGITVKNT